MRGSTLGTVVSSASTGKLHNQGTPATAVEMRRSRAALAKLRPPPWLKPQTPMRLVSISQRCS